MYLTENTVRMHYKENPLIYFRQLICMCDENYRKHINTVHGRERQRPHTAVRGVFSYIQAASGQCITPVDSITGSRLILFHAITIFPNIHNQNKNIYIQTLILKTQPTLFGLTCPRRKSFHNQHAQNAQLRQNHQLNLPSFHLLADVVLNDHYRMSHSKYYCVHLML